VHPKVKPREPREGDFVGVVFHNLFLAFSLLCKLTDKGKGQ